MNGRSAVAVVTLFPEGHRFVPLVVEDDYHIDPMDQPVAGDYLRVYDVPVNRFRDTGWLSPLDLWDLCTDESTMVGVVPAQKEPVGASLARCRSWKSTSIWQGYGVPSTEHLITPPQRLHDDFSNTHLGACLG